MCVQPIGTDVKQCVHCSEAKSYIYTYLCEIYCKLAQSSANFFQCFSFVAFLLVWLELRASPLNAAVALL